MNTENGDLNTLVEERLSADVDFNESIADLSDEEKEQAILEKKSELTNIVFTEINEKAKKNEELATNYKIRAEKAEKGKKDPKPAGEETPKNTEEDKKDLSSRDTIALINANVHEEDIDEVIRASKLLNKSISETLQDPITKTILEKREEHRNTAKATNTTAQRPGAKKISAQDVLDKANKGEMPEPGSPEADLLYKIRRGIKE